MFSDLLVKFFDSFDDTPPVTLLLNGEVLLSGGNTDDGNVNLAYLFDPATGCSHQLAAWRRYAMSTQ